jgi:hypothetical protein
MQTRQSIPYASVQITTADGDATGIGTTADASGLFYLNTPLINGYFLQVSSVGYQTIRDMLYDDYLIDFAGNIFLQKKTITLPPVVVTSNKKFNPLWLLLLGVPFLIKDDKKKVGAINTNTVVLVGAGFLLLKGMNFINQLFNSLGLGPGPGAGEQGNPESAWKPNYWKENASASKRAYLTSHHAEYWDAAGAIYYAFGLFSDNYSGVLAEINRFGSKSDISFLAERFYSRYGLDLLTTLKSGIGFLPWDGLSDAHMTIILNYVKNLPTT